MGEHGSGVAQFGCVGGQRPVRCAGERVRSGTPYIGSSAGSAITSPTMMTTNDMPIVRPPSFDALGFIPFQLNCHYLDPDPDSA